MGIANIDFDENRRAYGASLLKRSGKDLPDQHTGAP